MCHSGIGCEETPHVEEGVVIDKDRKTPVVSPIDPEHYDESHLYRLQMPSDPILAVGVKESVSLAGPATFTIFQNLQYLRMIPVIIDDGAGNDLAHGIVIRGTCQEMTS